MNIASLPDTVTAQATIGAAQLESGAVGAAAIAANTS